ncbi:diguanylate cyclase [Gallaecimonas sp. GXIMD4217]|uniref:diguanylate cyclase n=1 Tax=Gallaecimonas sp. GXIMD4217 TaxID=3131927 RepID=UPI00311AE67C
MIWVTALPTLRRRFGRLATFWLALLLPLLITQAHAAEAVPPARVGPGLEHLDLTPHLALLEDKEGSYNLVQIQSPAFGERFRPASKNGTNFGFTTSTWWARLTLDNPSNEPVSLVLRQDYPLIDHLDFWSTNQDGLWSRIATGDRMPFDSRPLDHRLFLFPVELPANSTKTFYFRFQTQGALNIGLAALSPPHLMDLIASEYLALGIYYGGFIVLLVYNLIMYLSVRERTFAYYLLYLLSYGLYMSVHNGLSFQYLWPGNTWLANQSLLMLLALSLVGASLFTRAILSTATVAPRADKIAHVFQIAALACLAVSPFIPYHTLVVPLSALTLVMCGHMLVLGIISLAIGSGSARYYMVAFSALLVGVLAYMLKTFGVLPHNALTQNAFQIGSLIEMVLLSLAVASRLNELKKSSYADALTRLFNRRFYDDRVAVEFLKAQQNGHPLSLVVIDVDCFKAFNDTFGHARGDNALRAVANILGAVVRKPAYPCRYGGEEFVLLLPGTDQAAAAVIAERIRAKVAKDTASTFRLTVSLGHATYQQGNFPCPGSLFEAADYALYTAKENGRNQVVAYADCPPRRKEDHQETVLPQVQAE